MSEQQPIGTRYWTLLKFAVPLLVVLVTLRIAPGDWRGMVMAFFLLSTLWAYAVALWFASPLSWCIILVENATLAVIFFTMFIWLNGDMQGVWPQSLTLPREMEVWLAITAALLGAGQLATLKYFRRRRPYFIPGGTPAPGRCWLLAIGVQLLPLLPAILQANGL